MRLRLNLSDIDLQLKVNGWEDPYYDEDDDYMDRWCDVEFNLASRYINYNPSGEILMSGEVSWMYDCLDKLFAGKLEEEVHLWFAEPDLELYIRPARRLYDVPGKIVYRNGYMDVDIDGDIEVNLWCSDGCLGANTLKMGMSRTDLHALYTYLGFVVGKISADNSAIMDYMKRGMILPE